MLEDERLKWKLKRGSSEALTRIFEKYVDSMLSLATGLLGDVEAAQDVVQDVFVSLVQSRPSLRVRGSLSGYLAVSVVNRVRDRKRRLRTQARGLGNSRIRTREQTGPEQAIILSEQAKLIAQAVARLPDQQREVVLLRLKAGMTFGDIARLQRTSLSTALSRYRYGIEKLRSCLNGQMEP